MIFKDKKRTPIPVLFETDRSVKMDGVEGVAVQVTNPGPKSINEKKEIVAKYLDELLNGTEISQLSISDELTDLAKESLRELQEYTLTENLSSAREELASLRANCDEVKKQLDAMKPLYDEIVVNKESVARELDELTKKRDVMIGEVATGIIALREEKEKELDQEIEEKRRERLSQVEQDVNNQIQSKQQELEELQTTATEFEETFNKLKENYNKILVQIKESLNNVEVSWETISENDGIYALEGFKLEGYVNDLIKAYAEKMGVSRDVARNEFMTNSPELFAIIKRIEYNDERFMSIKKCCNNITSIRNAVANIKLPVYYINGNKKALPSNVVNNIKLIQREAELENMALEERAKRIIAEKRLEKIMKILLPYVPNDVDLQEQLATGDNPLDWLKR